MFRVRITDPDGWSEVVEGVFMPSPMERDAPRLFELRDILVCIEAGCPDAFGWKAEYLDGDGSLGRLQVPEVERRMLDLLYERLERES